MKIKKLEELTDGLTQTVSEFNNNLVFRPYRFCEVCSSVTSRLAEMIPPGGGSYLGGAVYMHEKCGEQVSNHFERFPGPVQSKLKWLEGKKHQTELFVLALEKSLQAVNRESDKLIERYLRARIVTELVVAAEKE